MVSSWLLLTGWVVAPLSAKTIYVDCKLNASCDGSYSVKNRDASGKDGNAYVTLVEAANLAEAGDVVVIREGTYHANAGPTQNDVLWPKHSGTREKPIVFKSLPGETVILGKGVQDYPLDDSEKLSIAACVVTLKGVSHLRIEGLEFREVGGWLFARDSHHVEIRDCVFADATHGAKADARLVECQFFKFINCSFVNGYDNLSLNKSDWVLVQDCYFSSAAHTPLALRGCNFNVIRNCRFENKFFKKSRAEKLVEVYDIKVDRRDPANPVVLPVPAYNSTKHNLFENNFFGYHPYRPNAGAQPSAIQYSGQDGIIRRNVFCNPAGRRVDPANPTAVSGGMGLNFRWGGSWEGWKQRTDGSGGRWMGESLEAGYVTHNRIFNNVFFGYDTGCVVTPSEDAMGRTMNPPPMYETNPAQQYDQKFAFEDNLFLNNILSPGRYEAHNKWTWANALNGKPVALTMRGPMHGLRFVNNNFFAVEANRPALIDLKETAVHVGGELVTEPGTMNSSHSEMFARNLARDPRFANPEANDFRLLEGSPLIDAGSFLTAAVGSASGSVELKVRDVGFFYDGFGIEGESGDLIQFEGRSESARILRIDYARKTLTLDHALSWQDGQGVALAYSGNAPDMGVHEMGQPIQVGPSPVSKFSR